MDLIIYGFYFNSTTLNQQARDEMDTTRALLSPDVESSGILLGLRKNDIEGRFIAYRILNWMRANKIAVQIHHIKEQPHFLLQHVRDFIKLVEIMDKESKGRLMKPDMSVSIPHYPNPLDEVD